MSKNLTPFGGGMKQCAGADYVRASMTIFLHVLVTKYRYIYIYVYTGMKFVIEEFQSNDSIVIRN